MTLEFGSSGIRGRYGQTITPEFGLRFGRAVAELADEIVLGRDARTTGPTIAGAVTAGFAAAGGDVLDVGIQPTPTVAYAAREADLAVHVTASHNPPTDNGVKVFDTDGASIGPKVRERLGLAFEDPPGDADWDACGTVEDAPRLAEAHRLAVLDAVPEVDVDVVVDGANGPGGPFTAELLSRQGCRVASLNAHLDGTFPGRPSEPTPENLADLTALVQRRDADLGIAHDGDADRCVAVTGDGTVLSGDELMLVLVDALDPDRLAVPVDATMRVEEVATGEVVRTPVGDTYVSSELAERGGDLGGEATGSWIFPDVSLCPDGPHAAAVLAALVDEGPDLADRVPETYPLKRTSYPCNEPDKEVVVATFADAVAEKGEVTRVDGVRVDLDDAPGWALLRPSGTEPKVRLTVEARDEKTLEALADEFDEIARRCLP